MAMLESVVGLPAATAADSTVGTATFRFGTEG